MTSAASWTQRPSLHSPVSNKESQYENRVLTREASALEAQEHINFVLRFHLDAFKLL